jgi:hypothetical protein
MPKKERKDESKTGDSKHRIERMDERASPGSGEEEAPADIQPEDVENGTAR